MKFFQPDMRVNAFRPHLRTWEYTAPHAAVSITFYYIKIVKKIQYFFPTFFFLISPFFLCKKNETVRSLLGGLIFPQTKPIEKSVKIVEKEHQKASHH